MSHNDDLIDRYLRPATATAYVSAQSNVTDADGLLDIELKNIARDAAEVADESTADRLVQALEDAGHQGGRTLVGVVDESGAQVWHSGAEVPSGVVGGPLPSLSRLLKLRQAWVPHAVVVLDRIGADVDIVTTKGEDGDEHSVDGADSHITKSNPGGWSQRRYQQRAEEHWRDNARKVADLLVAEVERAGLDLVLVTGDLTQVHVLRDVLPEDVAEMVIEVDAGTRAADGQVGAIDEAIDQAVRQEASRRRDAQRCAVVDAIGAGAGATGRDDVLQALFESRVETLLIDLDATEGLEAHFGSEPEQVAGDVALLHSLDLDAARAPLVDVALRGAAATGAAVVMAHAAVEGLTDGIGASLRG